MKELIEISRNKSKSIRLMYDLGNVCNYKCWYCFPDSNAGTTGWPNVDIVKYNITHLIQYYFDQGFEDINLNFLGGEPSLWSGLGELVRHVKLIIQIKRNQKLSISMQTNGSRTIRWWQEFGQYFDHVSISVHNERVDHKHICQVGNLLLEKKVFCFAVVLMDHKNWDRCRTIIDNLLLEDPKFMIEAKPIHIDGSFEYTPEQKEFLKKPIVNRMPLNQIFSHFKTISRIPTFIGKFSDGSKIKTKQGRYFTMNGFNLFNGWQCNLGIDWLFINRQGNLTGTCGNKLYGLDYYYNINDGNFIKKFNPPIIPVICSQKKCVCEGEVVLPKKKL